MTVHNSGIEGAQDFEYMLFKVLVLYPVLRITSQKKVLSL